MKIKKIRISIIIITLMLLLIEIMSANTSVQAISSENMKLKINTDNLEEGRVVVEILLQDQTEGISAFTAYFHYNQEVFETISSKDIEVNVDEDEIDTIMYSKDKEKISIFFNNDIENIETICTINLKLKENIDIYSIEKLTFSLVKAESYSYETDITIDYETVQEEVVLSKEKPEEPEPENPDPLESLYLSTKIYKIGNNDIKEYEAEDKYISRVERKTTKENFINNLETNGNIRILKADGTELEDDEFVGTGMTLEVIKNDEKITLQIAVMGDLNGDGKVTATDLSTLNQRILQLVILKDEYYIAADLDENGKITATDLSTENQMILKLI